MSSKGHDFILELVQMKIKQLGYKLVASDSHYRSDKYPMPPTLINHRPDILGYRDYDSSICIGEAKYYGDLNSKRSINQIKDFVNLTEDENRRISLVIGFPLSEQKKFEAVINSNNIKINNKIILLKVPDRLIPIKENENN